MQWEISLHLTMSHPKTKVHAALNPKHGGYLDRAIPDAPKRKRTVLARRRRELAPAVPDPQSPNITGRYQDEEGYFTLAINQAGSHIECWLAEVLMAKHKRQKRGWRLGGDRINSSTFSLYMYTKPGEFHIDEDIPKGQITLSGSEITVSLSTGETSSQSKIILNADRPTASEAVLNALPEDNIILKSKEWMPLPQQYQTWLAKKLKKDQLVPLLEHYFDASNNVTIGARLDRVERAKKIDKHIAAAFSTKEPSGWHYSDLPLARYYGRYFLIVQTWDYDGTTRSLLSWLQIIRNKTAEDQAEIGQHDTMKSLADDLNLKPDTGTKKYRYDVEIVVGGLAGDVGIGLGGFTGGMIMQQMDVSQDPPKEIWKEDFLIWFGGISGGPSVGISSGFRNNWQQ